MKRKFNFKLLLKQILIILISVYVIFGVILFLFQNNLIYRTNNQDFNNCYNLDYTQKIIYNSTRFYFKKIQIV